MKALKGAHPEESPCRGFLRDCEIFENLRFQQARGLFSGMSHYLEAFFPILEISKWRISLNVPRVVPRLCPDNKRNSSSPHSSPLNSDSVHFVIAKNQMSIGKVLIFLSFLFRLTFRASETCLFTNFMAFCIFSSETKTVYFPPSVLHYQLM